MLRAMLPVFVSVIAWVALGTPTVVEPNVRLDGTSVMVSDVPVPVSDEVCGDPGALSMNCNVPERAPEATGLKLTPTVHDAPGATEVVEGV